MLAENVSQMISDMNSGIFTSVYNDGVGNGSTKDKTEEQAKKDEGERWAVSFKTLMDDFVAVKHKLNKAEDDLSSEKADKDLKLKNAKDELMSMRSEKDELIEKLTDQLKLSDSNLQKNERKVNLIKNQINES